MIDIIYEKLEKPINLRKENPFFVLACESPEFLSRFILDLRSAFNGEDSPFRFMHNDEEFKASKYGVFVENVFSLDFNDKKNVNALHKVLSCEFQDMELADEFGRINDSVTQFLSKLTISLSPATEAEPLDIIALLKAVDLKFAEVDGSLVSDIANYIRIIALFKEVRFAVFVNLKSFLSDGEMSMLKRELSENGVYALCLEGRGVSGIEPDERAMIVGQDLSVLLENYDEDG